ncbi:MAG: HAMP domain-containing sensor histidine kinase, partial [Clostridia bacterium]|nr:HAMP domain-containing sensor histidine kinase [Clostridia bacterium]
AFNDIFKFNTFSVASPFVLDGTVQGVIFVITKNDFLSEALFETSARNLISVVIAILAALITSYFLSRNLIKPLKKMVYGAKEIMLGRYINLDCTTKINEYNEVITTFNKMSTELEKHDKARSDFIANVSHDLRTPLTSIMGYVRGIMDGTIPVEMQNQYLGVVLSEAERMQHMVENNLDLSKYESGSFIPNMSEFDLNEIIRSIVISMEKRIREKNIVIQFKYENAKNIVEADESAIYRVIQNLLDNALKFASIGSEIEIAIKNKDNLAYCSIKNYGSSISEEEQKFIFDRYYKADQSRSTHKRGSGLGLYIVKSIINQHNQHINIVSDENSVQFEFTLNLK